MKTTILHLTRSATSLKIQLLFCLLACSFALYTQSCRRQDQKTFTKIQYHPEHVHYVQAFPNGEFPRDSRNIAIRYAMNVVGEEMTGKEETRELIKMETALPGKWVWRDRRTLVFQPDDWFRSGEIYKGTVDLKLLADTVPEHLRYFPFQFSTRPMFLYLNSASSGPGGSIGEQQVTGRLTTSNVEHAALVEKTLTATYNDKHLKIEWHHLGDSITHLFTIDSIRRDVLNKEVKLVADGKPINSASYFTRTLKIPGKGDFVITGTDMYSQEEQYIDINFSDKLDPVQNLDGIIHSKQAEFTFRINNGSVRAFPKEKLVGPVEIIVEPGLKNSLGYPFRKKETLSITFSDLKPQLRVLGNGTIIPKSDGSIPFPFEAVNIKAVDVRITKIYEKNILQFLQFNNMQGSRYLDYVGEVMLEKKIDLDNGKKQDFAHWNRYALDLASLIRTEPGAIYNVDIRFRRDYSIYACQNDNTAGNDNGDEEEGPAAMDEVTAENGTEVASASNNKYDAYLVDKKKESLWDYYNSWSYYYDNDYHSSPCQENYYKTMHGIRRNVLASDIGIMVKKEADGDLLIATSDLVDASPKGSVRIELYNFQQQRMRYAYTDAQGFARFNNLPQEPFVAVASHGSQRGYLKFNESQLSLSSFEISGSDRHKGIEGYLYTERGVWRPGDSIFITFLLEDRDKVLPAKHPVIFELFNPSGQLVQREIQQTGLNGFFSFHTGTGLDAPTGNYAVKVNVGGIFFNRSLKVETIKPNRLKLQMNLPENGVAVNDKNIGELQVNWLHGAPASNMKAEVSVTVKDETDAFPQYKNYIFHDPLKGSWSENAVIFEGSLNENGTATIPNNIRMASAAPGPMKAVFYCKAIEEGGDFSTDYAHSTFYPFEQYVGVKTPDGDGEIGVLFTDKEHTIDVTTIGRDGKAVDSKVEVMLYRLEWRWWWDYYRDLSSYNGRMYNDPVQSTTLQTVKGKAQWKVKIPENEYGRYFLRVIDEKGHSSGKVVYFDYPGWYSRRQEKSKGTVMLNFSSSKSTYKVGETAVIEIPEAYNGRALVTIENAPKVLHAQWIRAKEKNTTYSFRVTKDMAPNVYASITLLQPHAQTVNDLPIRMYGVIPIMVDDPGTHLEPELKMPEIIEPEQTVKLRVSEKKGKKMTYTIAMVDEGLLDLTHFRTPDPWQQFNSKEALKVKYYDLFDEVLGNYAGNLKKLMSVGGDGYEEATPGKGTKVQRFKPMVKFIGPFTLEAGRSATHSIKMPQYIGSVRTMLIAGYDGAYGTVEKTTPVRKPLMVLGTMPRVLGPEEEVMLPVTVFAMEEHVKDVTIKVKTSSILEVKTIASKDIYFKAKGEQMLYFPMKVKDQIGIASVEIIATSGNETARYNIELEVRPPNPYSTRSMSAMVASSATEKFDYQGFGIKGTNSGVAEVSALPAINLESRLGYLIRYPHGCIEQTTSSVFPQLYVQDLMKLPDAKKKEIEKNIKAGIKRLYLFQLASGGMSYWPGSRYNEASEWGSNYAGHFLIAAKMKGYNVPAQMLDNLLRFQAEQAKNWNHERENREFAHYYNSNDVVQAYRLYLLALAGKPEMGAMNRMRSLINEIEPKAKWQLAAAYYLSGQKSIALEIIKEAPVTVEPYTELGYTYGSDRRDRAIILEAMVTLGQTEKAFPVVLKISDELRSDHWMSTQETAYSLMAMSKYASLNSKGIELEYRINGGEWKKLNAQQPIQQVDLGLERTVSGSLELKNNMATPVYVNIITTGIARAGHEIAENKNLDMDITYLTLEGDTLDPTSIPQGTDFYAEIRVENTSDRDRLDELALSSIFPSGWQIYNPRMEGRFEQATSEAEYMDVRDDRVYIYFDLYRNRHYRNSRNQNNEKVFRIALNASYEGKYYMPGIYTEAMYDKNIHAHSKGRWVTVTKAKVQ